MLSDLPEEIILQICSQLTVESIINLSQAYGHTSDAVSNVVTIIFNRYLRSVSKMDFNLGKKFRQEGWDSDSSPFELIHSLFYRTHRLLSADSLRATVARTDLIGLADNMDFPQRRVTTFVVYNDKVYLSLNDSSVESRNLNDLSKCMSVLLKPFDGVFPDYVLTKGCQIHLKGPLLGAADARRQKMYLWNVETEFLLAEIAIAETGFPYDLKINSKNVFILSGFSLIVWRIDSSSGIKNPKPIVIPECEQQDNWLERHSLQVSEDYVVTKSTSFDGPGYVNYIHIRRCGPDGFIGPIIRNVTSPATKSITDYCLSPRNILVLFYSTIKATAIFQRQLIEVMDIDTGEILHQIPTRKLYLIFPITWFGDDLYVKIIPQATKDALPEIERWNPKSQTFGVLQDITLGNIADLIHIGFSHVIKIFNEFPMTPHVENYDFDEVSTFKIRATIYDLWESAKEQQHQT